MRRKSLEDSTSLLVEYPCLSEQPGWAEFAEEFDKLERKGKRKKALQRQQVTESVRELLRHCRVILNGEGIFPIRDAAGNAVFLSERQITERRINAAIALAGKVEMLSSSSQEATELRKALDREARRKETQAPRRDKANASATVCCAFLKFVEREQKLPTKNELNIEANRLTKRREETYFGERQFGTFFTPQGTLEKHRVYESVTDFDDKEGGKLKPAFMIVPQSEWDEVCWLKSSGLTEFTTPLGFKGLREAHGKKGKQGKTGRKG